MQKVNGQQCKLRKVIILLISFILFLSLSSCSKKNEKINVDDVLSDNFNSRWKNENYTINSLERYIYIDVIEDDSSAFERTWSFYIINYNVTSKQDTFNDIYIYDNSSLRLTINLSTFEALKDDFEAYYNCYMKAKQFGEYKSYTEEEWTKLFS